MELSARLQDQLNSRKIKGNLRELKVIEGLIDFSSNDYLGLSRNDQFLQQIAQQQPTNKLGSTGSRLLTGNNSEALKAEKHLSELFESEDALIVNSGYAANLAVLSAIPQRGDTILYDELCHASIKDGMRLSTAKRISFLHNDLADLERKINHAVGDIYIFVESIYSMDGDESPLQELIKLSKKYTARLIVDEAHATGIYGKNGGGVCEAKGLEKSVFCRIYTFGKAIGYHGAAIVGSKELKKYLINFSRPVIYTTAIPPSDYQIIRLAFEFIKTHPQLQETITNVTNHYLLEFEKRLEGKYQRTLSNHPIQTIITTGNQYTIKIAEALQEEGFDVRPILSPTVKEGEERIRICLHAFNTKQEVTDLINTLKKL